jgi:hypothetical protein
MKHRSVLHRLAIVTLALAAVPPVPASAVRVPFYRVGFIGLAPLSVTSTGFTDGQLCATVVNDGTQAVTEMTLSATYDDVRVKPTSAEIKRRIDPGTSAKFNCVPLDISATTNVILGRVERIVLADGTVAAARPFASPPPFPAGTLTTADGAATPAAMPIDLSVCQAALYQYDLKHYFQGLDVTYVNTSDAALQSVAFELVLPSGPHSFVDVGPFESGQTVTHRLKPTPPIGPDEFRSAFAHCIVTKIDFADGRTWTTVPN